MQEPIKRTEIQNKIRFLNDNKIPYEIYIGKYINKECIIVNYYENNYYYDIDDGYCIDIG